MVPAILVFKMFENASKFDLDGVDLDFAPWTTWLRRLTVGAVLYAAQIAGWYFLMHGSLEQKMSNTAGVIYVCAFLALFSSIVLTAIAALTWALTYDLRRNLRYRIRRR